MWRMNCAQVAGFDEAIIVKDMEIDLLRSRVAELEASMGGGTVLPTSMVPAVLSPVLSTRGPHTEHYSCPRACSPR